MLNLRTKIRETYYGLWLTFYRFRNPHIVFGENVRLKGIPFFSISPEAEVFIGSDVTFTSRASYNPMGLCKPCSICLEPGAQLSIGDYCGFSGVSIYCVKEVRIGNYLTCGGNVFIWDTDFHPIDPMARRNNLREVIKSEPIVVGDDVFIGANAILLKGITIGDRAVIAAGSVVTKSVPSDEIWGGNPARFLKHQHPVNSLPHASSI